MAISISPHPLTAHSFPHCRWATNNGAAFANSVVCRWQARGYARDASHVRSSTPTMYLWQRHLTNPARAWCICSDNDFCSPECRAHGLQRGGVASFDRETARRWPRARASFCHKSQFWMAAPASSPRGEVEVQVRHCHGTRHPDQQPVSLSVWSRSPPSRHVAGTCLSRVARGVRNASTAAAAGPSRRDHHGGGSHDGPTGLPPNLWGRVPGTHLSTAHCRPQGRSCSDPCGESSQDSTHGGPRAMRVIQRHRPPGPGRHWPAPPRPRCLPGALGTCRALAGSVNRSKSCAWTTPPFS